MKKSTVVINLFGGSGTGKSTLAADLFAKLKLSGVNVELVREYIKTWVWDERQIKRPEEQVYIFAKQAKEERILYGKVDCIITDSPLWLPAFYENYFHKNDKNHECIMTTMTEGYLGNISRRGEVIQLNFWLSELDNYQSEGRWQTQTEASSLHNAMLEFLEDGKKVDLVKLSSIHDERLSVILEKLKEIG